VEVGKGSLGKWKSDVAMIAIVISIKSYPRKTEIKNKISLLIFSSSTNLAQRRLTSHIGHF